MKHEIQTILNDLFTIRNDNKLDITDEVLFSETIKIYLSQYIQSNKEKNIKAVQEKPQEKPASEKQIKYVEKLGRIFGFEVPNNLTGLEAHALIEKYRGQNTI